MKNIRNFSIIAHIDHGKSTLADRFIQICGGLTNREMTNQVLDSMDIERERGITIKSQIVNITYKSKNRQKYQLNFIDTPGHVDFSYELSRSLAACEGALLVIDATQGVEAQTVANCYTALDQGLQVIPVLNKIDSNQADPNRVINEIEEIIGIEARYAKQISAKSGVGVNELLESLIYDIPPPIGDTTARLQAIIIDSWFDSYLGIISLIRIKNGVLNVKDKIIIMSTGRKYNVDDIGVFTPKREKRQRLSTGEVGYFIANIKEINGAPIGATITLAKDPASKPLPGFKQAQPKVFVGIFPVSTNDYEHFREALAKLRLNDSALFYEQETSLALGFGFRCGFLGLLHMEVIQERLEREYNLNLIISAPTVVYEIITRDGNTIHIDSPSKLDNIRNIIEMREPIVLATILVPSIYIGSVISLCVNKRGIQRNIKYIGTQVNIEYELPMSEVVLDLFDKLKSISKGYASLDYHFLRFQSSNLVKLDILINGEKIDALSIITYKNNAYKQGNDITKKMQELIPRQMFDIAIQAAICSNIIARTTVKALRKNVTDKCYGGDVSRKLKLLKKQKSGKKRMKSMGKIDIPQDAFLAILKINKDK